MGRRSEGADRQALASSAASPTQSGRDDHSTAHACAYAAAPESPDVGGMPESMGGNLGNPRFETQKPPFPVLETPVSRADVRRALEELEALQAPLRRRRGAEIVAMGTAWEAEHPEAFAYIERRFLEEAANERRVSMSALVGETRKKALDGLGRTLINNSITCHLARRMRELHPAEARFLRFRRSVVDELEG